MADTPLFGRIALIGIGLIGSSLARAIKRHGGLCRELVAADASEDALATAFGLGIVDQTFLDPAAAARGADLVILCSPLGSYEAIGQAIAPALHAGAIVSDIGSTKRVVQERLGPLLPDGVHLIPGHPVAGTEKSGPENGFASLFENRYVILTPARDADPAAVDKVSALWRGTGAIVELMDASHHDRVLAITSHLPHLIAYTIVGTASDLESQLAREEIEETGLVRTHEVIRFSAGGFRDFTRIAGSNPVMWRDIFLANRDAVLEMLGRFTEDLIGLQRAIRFGEGEELYDWFARTREIRRGVVEMGQAGSFNPQEPGQAQGRSPAPNPTEAAAAEPQAGSDARRPAAGRPGHSSQD